MKIIIWWSEHNVKWYANATLSEKTSESWFGEVGEFGRSGEACYVKLKNSYGTAPAFFTAKENIIFEEPGSSKKYLSFDEAVDRFKLIKEGV